MFTEFVSKLKFWANSIFSAFLKESLDAHVSKLEVPVKVIHTEERVGLIQARLMGAKVATGQVLTFLDAHCECTQGL